MLSNSSISGISNISNISSISDISDSSNSSNIRILRLRYDQYAILSNHDIYLIMSEGIRVRVNIGVIYAIDETTTFSDLFSSFLIEESSISEAIETELGIIYYKIFESMLISSASPLEVTTTLYNKLTQ